MPVIFSGEFAVDSLNIASGDTLTLNGTANLDVEGAMVNNGIVTVPVFLIFSALPQTCFQAPAL